jgi:hypothetical protein
MLNPSVLLGSEHPNPHSVLYVSYLDAQRFCVTDFCLLGNDKKISKICVKPSVSTIF